MNLLSFLAFGGGGVLVSCTHCILLVIKNGLPLLAHFDIHSEVKVHNVCRISVRTFLSQPTRVNHEFRNPA
jgi:hypothetical protein